jgi:NitT/TauT family transport system substrate-binding protein
MPDALEKNEIDAYSAWEPTPTISLSRNPKNKAIYKGLSTDWVVLPRVWVDRNPDIALMLMASYVRAINWMRRSSENLNLAAKWVLADGSAFTGESSKLSLEKAIDIARKDLLDVPGAPSIPSLVDGVPPLSREFNFLKEIGRIPANATDAVLRDGFNYGDLKKIQSNPKPYGLFHFDYDQ